MNETRTYANPFPGLRPFETEEYRLFFGREGQSDALIERLQRARFLAVVGTSGSGKSSLVRAGLLPALQGGMMAGAGWRVAVMRPGHDPVGNLAHELLSEGVLAELGAGLPRAEAEAVVEATLRRGSLGLVNAVRQARLASHEKLLVVVDQFEELFRFRAARAGTEDDASAFVKLLLETKQSDRSPEERLPIYVVLTMRSDFLGDCAQFQGLPEAINDGQYLIPRMTRDERRFAIVGPVRVARARMTEPLVSRLLNDVGDNPDQLPILQHALMRTWDYWHTHRRDGEQIGIEHYEAVGTMSDALSLHADEAWDELPDERSRRIAETLFKALTERGADNREIRRPTRMREICDIAGARETEVAAVIEVFRREGRSFLMPPAGVALNGETVIDISHESLIRNWERLREWVRDEAEAARIYRRLAEAAMAYRTREGGLLDNVTLQWVLKWRDKYAPNRAWGVRYHPEFDAALAYLEESRAASDASAAAERAREHRELERARAFAEQQARSARRLRWLMFALLGVLFVALFTAGYAVNAQRRAVAAQRQAETQQQKASALQRMAEQGRQELAAALEETKAAQSDAEKSRDEANTQAGIARREEKKVEGERKRADEEARRAEQQATKALAAKKEAERRALALAANGKFRDATILAERGAFADAAAMYKATIQGLQETGVQDTEGVADTYVQLGQTHFGAMPNTELTSYDNYYHVTEAVDSYDKAVKHYEEAGVNAKAADTLLSVGATLLKIANDVPVGRNVSRASDELAALGISKDLATPGGIIHFDEGDDPKVKLKNQALERYKSAFLLYRKAGNEVGMMKAAYRIGNFYLRDELPAWQDKTPTLDIALCNGSRQEYIPNRKKALCYFKELERLSLTRGKKDANIQRLLVWVGSINAELGDAASAETYFNRAQEAYTHLASGTADPVGTEGAAWFHAAEVSEAAGLNKGAYELYERAFSAYERAGDFSGQAQTYFRLGSLVQKVSNDGPGAVSSELNMFKLAIAAYRQHLKAGNAQDERNWRDEFFDIGSFADDNYDEALALDAYNVALAFGEARQDELIQARAWSSIASLQAQNAPEVARQSYMRSFALYSKMRDNDSTTFTAPKGDEYLKDMERISAAVLSLDREMKARAAESLCPFPVIAYAQPTATKGDTITFSAYAVHPDESKLTYEWTFNSPSATIVERTLKPYPSVRVSTNGVGKGDLTVTLVVSDGTGASACKQTAYATTKVADRPPIPLN